MGDCSSGGGDGGGGGGGAGGVVSGGAPTPRGATADAPNVAVDNDDEDHDEDEDDEEGEEEGEEHGDGESEEGPLNSDDEGGEGGEGDEGGEGLGKGFASASHVSATVGSIGSIDAPPFYASHRASARSVDTLEQVSCKHCYYTMIHLLLDD